MSNVISSLLVGIGIEFDKKSAKETESGIDGIKSKALQLGAVVAGAYGIKKLATDFADSADMLGKFSETFGGTANEIQALGSALTTEGGSLESFMGQLESLERARARIKVGDVAFFAPAGKAGLDPNDVANAENAAEAYLGLANSFAKMNQQERINAAEALGLDASSIRLLSQGRESVDLLVEKYKTIRPLTDEMTGSAAEFNRQWVEIKANVSSVTDTIGLDLVEAMNGPLDQINNWIEANKELVDSNATTFTGIASLIAGSGLLLQLSGIASIIPGIGAGLANILKMGGRGGLVGAAAATGYATGSVISDNLSDETNNSIGKHIARVLALLGNDDAKKAYMTNENVNQITPYLESSPTLLQPRQETQQSTVDSSGSNLFNKSEMKQTINVNANFTLDGQVIDRKIMKVVDGMAQNAIDDISSSTGG
tara:strand:- start:3186 stop:4469 length:1284 start_codon:yes stop_codon:yes gene_type:complete